MTRIMDAKRVCGEPSPSDLGIERDVAGPMMAYRMTIEPEHPRVLGRTAFRSHRLARAQ